MSRLDSTSIDPYGRVYHPRRTFSDPKMLFDEIDEYFRDGVEVKKGDVVFDVGANIGTFAIWIAQKCEGDVSLYCFEPAPPIYAALERNLAENAWLKKARTKLLNIALSSLEEAGRTTEMFYFANFPADSTLDIERKRGDLEHYFAHHGDRFKKGIERVVPGPVGRGLGAIGGGVVEWAPKGPIGQWAVNRFMGLERVECAQEALGPYSRKLGVDRIDLLKIDVEGFEPQVLSGIDDETWQKIRQVVLETNNSRVPEMLALFEKHGFDKRGFSPACSSERGIDYAIVSAVRTTRPS